MTAPLKNRLKELRARARLTQQEVANLAGVDVIVVSRHENGARGMSHESIKTYARIFKVYTYQLFFEAAGPKDQWHDGEPPPVEQESPSNSLR